MGFSWLVLQMGKTLTKELKSLLMTVKEETEKVGLKLNIQKTKIVASWSFHRGFAGGEVVKKKQPICHCKRSKRWEFYPWVGKYPGVGNGNPLSILAWKLLLSKKYGHNLKVELFYLVGMFRSLSPGDNTSATLRKLLQGGRRRSQAI